MRRRRFPPCQSASLDSPVRVGPHHPIGGWCYCRRGRAAPAGAGAPAGDARPSEGQGDAALPGDIVLGLVEAVAVERVDEIATFRADADAAEAVLEPRSEVAGELRSGAVGAELMDTDRAGAAQQVWV